MANSTTSYQALLEQCAQKQSSALKKLYALEAPHFLALGQCLLQRNSDAEELVRESFVLIWRNANAYDPSLGSAKAWLYSIFRFRAQQKRKKHSVLSTLDTNKNQLLNLAFASPELLRFQHLDDLARNSLALAYLYGFDYAEIAKESHSSIQHVKTNLQDGLLRLTHLFTGWQSHADQHLILLGEYCLGLLSTTDSINTAHQLLQTEASAAQDTLLWEDVFSHLATSLPTLSPPPPYVLNRIYQDLGLTLEQAPVPQPKAHSEPTPKAALAPSATVLQTKFDSIHTDTANRPASNPAPHPSPQVEPQQTTSTATPIKQKKSRFSLGLIAAVFAISSALVVWAFMPKAPVVQLVQMSPKAGAILQAPGQSATPGWVLSVDAEGHVLLSPQVHTELESGQSVQLWTQRPNDTQIRSLGLVDPNQPVTLPVDLIGPVETGQIFEMTLESPQGASSPSGTILFIGRVVKFGDFKPLLDQSDV